MFSMRRVHRFFGVFLLLCAIPATAMAEPIINKTYSYFRIGGRTAEDLDKELENRGPLTRGTGHRHPGATEIKFGGDVTYVESGGRCSVGGARVTLRTHIILPRWAIAAVPRPNSASSGIRCRRTSSATRSGMRK